MGKIVVVNASFYGDERDAMKPLDQPVFDDVKYVVYTNRPDLYEDTNWDVIEVEQTDNFRLKAREIKTNIHTFLPDYEYWLWIDNSMQLKVNANDLVDRYMQVHDMVVTPHPERHNIDEESKYLIATRPEQINIENLKDMFNEFWDTAGYIPSALYATNVLLRKNTDKVVKFNELWWSCVQRVIRDQLSFTYSAYVNALAIGTFPGSNFWLTDIRKTNKPFLPQWQGEVDMLQ